MDAQLKGDGCGGGGGENGGDGGDGGGGMGERANDGNIRDQSE